MSVRHDQISNILYLSMGAIAEEKKSRRFLYHDQCPQEMKNLHENRINSALLDKLLEENWGKEKHIYPLAAIHRETVPRRELTQEYLIHFAHFEEEAVRTRAHMSTTFKC